MFARIGRCTSYGFGSTGIYYLQSKDLEVARRSTVGWKNFAFLQAFRGVGEMLRPIFGDEEELTAEPLITPLHCARVLRASYFLSLASPASAKSPWVDEEIRHLQTEKPEAPCLLIIVAGVSNATSR